MQQRPERRKPELATGRAGLVWPVMEQPISPGSCPDSGPGVAVPGRPFFGPRPASLVTVLRSRTTRQ